MIGGGDKIDLAMSRQLILLNVPIDDQTKTLIRTKIALRPIEQHTNFTAEAHDRHQVNKHPDQPGQRTLCFPKL